MRAECAKHMKYESATQLRTWLKRKPGLDELCARFPQEWAAVQSELAAIIDRGIASDLRDYLERLASAGDGRQREFRPDLTATVRSLMAHEAVKKLCLSMLASKSGAKAGKLRFNWFNGYIAQRLLFAHDLVRKPVSMRWFRLLWPLLWQRKRLMPLVQSRGIYCFYSRSLILALATLIAGRRCLEIGAGDGTLARFLQDDGVKLTATDNWSWPNSVHYPQWVQKLDAAAALRTFSPEVVLCSWPPARNDFERQVFKTKSVQLYIVIGSRHRIATGDWPAYEAQSAFALEHDKFLSALVLPPELEPAVYLFRRRAERLS